MRGLAEVYAQQFKTTLASMLQYRASLVIWLIGHVLEPVVYLVVWQTVSRSNGGSVGGFTTGGFAAYYVVLMLANHVTYTWIMYEYEYRVRQGALSPVLLRPVHPIHADIADNISSKLITLPGMILVAGILALAFRPSFSIVPWAAAAFLPALLLAFVLRFLVEWTLALSAFWTTRVSAVNQSYFVVALFFSGQIAPLTLLPMPIQAAAAILPFRWMIAFPVELFLGRLTMMQAAVGFAVQAAWIVAAFFLLRILWRAGLKIYTAVGG